MLELVLSLVLGFSLTVMITQVLVSVSRAADTVRREVDASAMWGSIRRVVREDVHGSAEVQAQGGELIVTEVDGRVFRYTVNPEGELVRVQSGGGTAVVALGVRLINCAMVNRTVTVTVTFSDGTVRQLVVSPLGASSASS